MAAVNDVYQFEIFGRIGSQTTMNVVHYSVKTVAGTGASDTEIVEAMAPILGGALKPAASAAWTFNGIRGKKIRPLPIGQSYESRTGNGPGALPGEPLPFQVTPLIKLTSSGAPSRVKGKKFLPPMTESENTSEGKPGGTAETLLLAVGAALELDRTITSSPGNTVLLTPVIFSRELNAAFEIDGHSASGEWATHRSRASRNRTDGAF